MQAILGGMCIRYDLQCQWSVDRRQCRLYQGRTHRLQSLLMPSIDGSLQTAELCYEPACGWWLCVAQDLTRFEKQRNSEPHWRGYEAVYMLDNW